MQLWLKTALLQDEKAAVLFKELRRELDRLLHLGLRLADGMRETRASTNGDTNGEQANGADENNR